MKDLTQEEKDILLRDLASRLPYGVNVEYTYKVTVIATNEEEILTKPLYLYSINTLDDMTVSGIDDDGYREICFFSEVKPYLFPLSSMTEEQGKELEKIDPEFYSLICENGDIYISMDVRGYDWLNKNHFDYRGLIPMGLAIDATNLNIY